MGLVNFAHMSVLMLATYTGLYLVSNGLTYLTAFAVTIAVSFALGFFLDVMLRPMSGKPHESMLVATIGLGIVIDSVVRLAWGTRGQMIASPLGERPLSIAGALVQPQSIAIVAAALICSLALAWFIKGTLTGTMLRAAAYDRELTRTFAAPVSRLGGIALGIATVLAAVAGMLFAPMTYVDLGYGLSIGIKGFVAAILGGYGSLIGAVLGGLLVGVIESVAGGYVSSAYKYPIVFLVLLIVLTVKPKGLISQ